MICTAVDCFRGTSCLPFFWGQAVILSLATCTRLRGQHHNKELGERNDGGEGDVCFSVYIGRAGLAESTENNSSSDLRGDDTRIKVGSRVLAIPSAYPRSVN